MIQKNNATEKLYEADSFCREFSAVVLCCRKNDNGWETVLDRTAFFPEGGGQLCDTGTLGGLPVTDVQEKEGVIVHYTDSPLEKGGMKMIFQSSITPHSRIYFRSSSSHSSKVRLFRWGWICQ